MGKKQRVCVQCETIGDELERRMDEVMENNAASFSEGVQRYYDGKWAALKEFQDWLAR